MDITSYLLGKQSGGGGTLQEKSVTITSNGTTNVTADTGYNGLSKAVITTNVPTAVDDYFTTTITNSNKNNFKNVFVKQMPAITLDSNVTNMQGVFSEWPFPMINISSLNTSNVTNMQGMFSVASLTNLDVSSLNTSNVTNMQSMFSNMTKITTPLDISSFDTSKATNMSMMFAYGSFISINLGSINTSNVTNMSSMFASNFSLKTINGSLDLTSCLNVGNMFNNCQQLEDLPNLSNIGKGYLTDVSEHYNNYKINLSSSSNLTHTSLMNVINGLYDIGTAGVPTQDLVLGATNLAKLSQAEKDIVTAKGWTLS